MQGIYTHIPETNYVPRQYSVAAILLFLFMVLILLVSVLNLLYFYISTFRSMCALLLLLLCHPLIGHKYILIVIFGSGLSNSLSPNSFRLQRRETAESTTVYPVPSRFYSCVSSTCFSSVR